MLEDDTVDQIYSSSFCQGFIQTVQNLILSISQPWHENYKNKKNCNRVQYRLGLHEKTSLYQAKMGTAQENDAILGNGFMVF